MFDLRSTPWTPISFAIWTLLYFYMAANINACCVPKCGLTRSGDVILHCFPNPMNDVERYRKWTQAVGETISALDPMFVYKNRRVCHVHFEAKDHTWTKRLSIDAVPTLLMPKPQVLLEQRAPFQDITNKLDSCVENLDAPVPSTPSGLQSVKPATPGPSTSHGQATVQSSRRPRLDRETAVLRKTVTKLMSKSQRYAKRLKDAMNLSENATFQKTLQKFTTLAALFTVMQFREVKKNKMGRRFTQAEKIMALSLYKRSPRTYRWLQVIFVLPSPLTLNRLIGRANLRPGMNENIFKHLKKAVKYMKPHEKLCVLMFDEMSLAPHFDYNQKQDLISGFTNDGKIRKKKIADHALVFMIRGVLKNFKQPVAYTFCAGSTKHDELAIMIKDIIKRLHSVGLRVIATVCDQGASNRTAIKNLIEETRIKHLKKNETLQEQIFEVDDEEVIPLFDPPHLIKGIRNNLLKYNLTCTMDGANVTAKWEHIIQLYNEDPAYKGIRLCKKLTEAHIHPDQFQKMKVKFATQVMSRRVAATLGYLAEHKILPQESTQTADVLLFFDDLFDSLNGSYDNSKKRSGKTLLGTVTPKSEHSAVWAKAKPILNSMNFIDNNGKVSDQVKTIKNFLLTINNVQYLKKVLSDKFKINSVWMRHFNQDPLENFFGSIRSHGYRNNNPTPAGFQSSFAALLISNLSGQHSTGSNCEEDSCKTVFKSMKCLFDNDSPHDFTTEVMDYNVEPVKEDFEKKMKDPRVKAQLQYVTGYLLKKTKRNVFKSCKECEQCFYDVNSSSQFIQIREYKKQGRHLTYPSNDLVKLFSEMQDISTHVLQTNSIVPNIKMYMKTLMYTGLTFEICACEKHRTATVEYMLELGCKFFIWNWTRDVNKLLIGTRLQFDQHDEMKAIARNHCNKKKQFKNNKNK